MTRNVLILFFCLLLISGKLRSQNDPYPGKWQLDYKAPPGKSAINFELQIAAPNRNILYPAILKIACDSFKAAYQLLLVKKDNWELSISKNKYAESETPFSLADVPFFVNGVFEYGKDIKGLPLLIIKRIQSKADRPPLRDTAQLTPTGKITAFRLQQFLKDADITLKKINNIPWQDKAKDDMLSPELTPAYFGLLDTMHLDSRYATIELFGSKKANTDIISASLNGHTIFDQVALNKKKHADDILLDTGLNILTVFADNFGSGLPNMGKLQLESAGQKFNMDFTRKPDSAAAFIVARLYCDMPQSKEISFQYYNPPVAEVLKKDERLISSLVSTSREITLAIWDDAAEDGDSISISIDGKWLVQGFPVKKTPQFITVTLKPGPNTIDFVADNLGSIPPNTSVLEIIDGKKRKSFFMETNLGENNLIKIFYDLNGAPK